MREFLNWILDKFRAFFVLPIFRNAVISLLLISSCGIVYYAVIAGHNPIRLAVQYDTPNLIIEDKYIGYVLRGNVKAKIPVGHYFQTIYTDQFGNRAPYENSLPNYSGVNIVSIGCSQTWGHGVPAEQTYSYLLGDLLKVSSLNLGVSSYGGVTSLRKLQRFWDLKPKFVVYGYWFDHDNRNLSPCAFWIGESCLSVPYINLNQLEPKFMEPLEGNKEHIAEASKKIRDLGAGKDKYSTLNDVYWLLRRDLSRELAKFSKYIPAIASARSNFTEIEKELGARYLLDNLYRETVNHGAILIVVFIPNYLDGREISPIPGYIISELHKLNVILLDMTEEFNRFGQLNGFEYLQIPNDGHLSSHAHMLIAKKIAGAIELQEKEGNKSIK